MLHSFKRGSDWSTSLSRLQTVSILGENSLLCPLLSPVCAQCQCVPIGAVCVQLLGVGAVSSCHSGTCVIRIFSLGQGLISHITAGLPPRTVQPRISLYLTPLFLLICKLPFYIDLLDMTAARTREHLSPSELWP